MTFTHLALDEQKASDSGPDEDYLGLIEIAFFFGDIDMRQVKLALAWLELQSVDPTAARLSH